MEPKTCILMGDPFLQRGGTEGQGWIPYQVGCLTSRTGSPGSLGDVTSLEKGAEHSPRCHPQPPPGHLDSTLWFVCSVPSLHLYFPLTHFIGWSANTSRRLRWRLWAATP